MANYGKGFWSVGASITNTRSLPWSPEEDATLARGFIDLDLDGSDLHTWCRENGILRSPGAIDARLEKLDFFDTEAIKSKIEKATIKPPLFHPRLKPDDKLRLELARRELANQVKLAVIEALTAPLYRPKDEDWKMR